MDVMELEIMYYLLIIIIFINGMDIRYEKNLGMLNLILLGSEYCKIVYINI